MLLLICKMQHEVIHVTAAKLDFSVSVKSLILNENIIMFNLPAFAILILKLEKLPLIL